MVGQEEEENIGKLVKVLIGLPRVWKRTLMREIGKK